MKRFIDLVVIVLVGFALLAKLRSELPFLARWASIINATEWAWHRQSSRARRAAVGQDVTRLRGAGVFGLPALHLLKLD